MPQWDPEDFKPVECETAPLADPWMDPAESVALEPEAAAAPVGDLSVSIGSRPGADAAVTGQHDLIQNEEAVPAGTVAEGVPEEESSYVDGGAQASEDHALDPWDGFGGSDGDSDSDAVSATDDFDLPDYDPAARQRPWEEPEPEQEELEAFRGRARFKAADIAVLMDVPRWRDLNRLVDWLTEFFVAHPHPTTHQAIREAVMAGADWDLLRDMVALRALWQDRPEWWAYRSPRTGRVFPIKNGAAALSWRLAFRICMARKHLPPEDMIDDQWFLEWQGMRPIAADRVYFTQFIARKVEEEEEEKIAFGLWQESRKGDLAEVGDDWTWYQRCQRWEDIRFGFSIITPWDWREGKI